MSDISEFAEWEAKNRSLSHERTSQEEQRIREMEGHRDSSNDPHTDSEESEEEDIVQFGMRELFAPSTSQESGTGAREAHDTPPQPAHEDDASCLDDSTSLLDEVAESCVGDLLPEVRQELDNYQKENKYFPSSPRQKVEAYAKEHPFYTRTHAEQSDESDRRVREGHLRVCAGIRSR